MVDLERQDVGQPDNDTTEDAGAERTAIHGPVVRGGDGGSFLLVVLAIDSNLVEVGVETVGNLLENAWDLPKFVHDYSPLKCIRNKKVLKSS